MKVSLIVVLMLLVAACVPASEPGRVDSAAAPSSTAASSSDVQPTTPAPAAQQPAASHPQSAQRPPAELLVKNGVDYSCSIPADCAIKDVGNCCGYYPACVNANSPTFPEKVKADCAAGGMAGVCGFPSIQSCDCMEGRCTGIAGPEAATLKVD
jgi:hypothetical protein